MLVYSAVTDTHRTRICRSLAPPSSKPQLPAASSQCAKNPTGQRSAPASISATAETKEAERGRSASPTAVPNGSRKSPSPMISKSRARRMSFRIGKPSTLLARYEADLRARGGSPYNAQHPRIHLPGVILNKPVALLGATELRKWRDSLLAKGLAPGTVNRTKTGLRAALELAAAHDPRIGNERAWKIGLAALPDSHRARNVILDDVTVRRIVAAAYDHDRALGIMTEVAAMCGARLSQLSRLDVA